MACNQGRNLARLHQLAPIFAIFGVCERAKSLIVLGRVFENRSVVPTKALARRSGRRESRACFCAIRFAARTARSIGPGRWSRTDACRAARVVQRQVLYLGEINDSQRASWSRAIEAFDEGGRSTQIALFPEDRVAPALDCDVVSIRLSQMRLRRPRQWGACWLAMVLWDQLRLDEFWAKALPPSREGTSWLNILKTLASYQLISPGSEWRLHRQWFDESAMGDLLGEDAALVLPNNLYRCLDKLVAHKKALFTFLRERWKDLFQADFEVLLYDLTSTYFECDPPDEGKRKFGYSRDKRSGLRAGGDRADRHAGRLSAGLRGHGRQHLGQDDAEGVSGQDRGAIWRGQTHLGDGSRHSDRGGPGRDAGLVDADPLSRGHAARAADQAGKGARGQALGRRARERAGQIDRRRGRDLRLRPQRSPAREGTGDAPSSPAQADQASARTPARRT